MPYAGPTTANRYFNVPPYNYGTNPGDVTWDVPENANATYLDQILGQTYQINNPATAVTLTTANTQYMRILITGTLTGNTTITFPAIGGYWIVENRATMGTFTLTIASASGGNTISIPTGVRLSVFSDPTIYPGMWYVDDGIVPSTFPTINVAGNTTLNSGYGGSTKIFGDTLLTGTTVVTAGSFTVGSAYTILTVGTTDYTAIGAANNTVGTNFIATGAGSGTGTATTGSATLRVAGNITPTGRVTPRVQFVSSSTTITPTSDICDEYEVRALASNTTIAAPSGTPIDGQKLIIRIKSDATGGWTIAWNAIYRAIGTTLPTGVVANKTTYVGCIYNSADSVWDVVATTIQA